MASTMTSIQREQKKLKRNMRHYRRRLREARNLPVKKSKPFKVGWIAYDTDTSFIKSSTSKLQANSSISDPARKTLEDAVKHKDKRINGNGHSKHDRSSRLQAQVEIFLKSVDDHVSAIGISKEEETTEDSVGDDKLYDKNGRRRFIFGSSQIGASNDVLKYLESETDGNVDKHDALSDISSEGGNVDDEVFKETSKKGSTNTNKKYENLMRLNSAYFTPIEMKDDNVVNGHSSQTISPVANAIDLNSKVCDNNGPGNTKVPLRHGQTQSLPTLSSNDTTKPDNVSSKKIPAIFFNLNKPEQKVRDEPSTEKPNEQSTAEQKPGLSQSQRKNKNLNFGDLIKFRHGVNTKKLFSMVDQLASKYGITSTETKKSNNRRGLNTKNAHYTIPEVDHASQAKSSFFYAMKYGYGKPNDDTQQMPGKFLATVSESTTTGTHTQVELLRESQTESLGALPSVTGEQDLTDGTGERDLTGVTLKTIQNEGKLEFPQINTDHSTSYSRQSIFSNFDEKDIDQRSIPRHNRGSTKSTNRRSSILDDSNYVSNMRRKSIVQERLKMFEDKYNADRLALHNRRVNTRKDVISEHQRKAEDSKITWTSALGSMKLVHTLGDLTDYI